MTEVQLLREVRNSALEEAAQVAEKFREDDDQAGSIAAAIRLLKKVAPEIAERE